MDILSYLVVGRVWGRSHTVRGHGVTSLKRGAVELAGDKTAQVETKAEKILQEMLTVNDGAYLHCKKLSNT